MKIITIYSEDNQVGLLPYTDIKIEKDYYLYGGEKKEIYNVYIYLEDKMIFTAREKKEILQQSNKLFIYNFN